MKTLLQDIVDISSGLVLSRKVDDDGAYKYSCLSYKMVDKYGIVDLENNKGEMVKTKEEIHSRYLSQKDDIILLQLAPFTAIYVSDELENFLINSNFIVLKIKDKTKLNPDFLAWFLNSEEGYRQLVQDARSTKSVSMVNLASVGKIEIELPDIETQKNIGFAYCKFNDLELNKRRLAKRERQCMTQTLQKIYKTTIKSQHKSNNKTGVLYEN